MGLNLQNNEDAYMEPARMIFNDSRESQDITITFCDKKHIRYMDEFGKDQILDVRKFEGKIYQLE